MGYAADTGVIIYWKPDQHFINQRAHHVWFDKYNSRFSIKDKHTTGALILQQDIESLIHDSDLLNLIPCELDLISTTFSDTTTITYKLSYLPLERKFFLIY